MTKTTVTYNKIKIILNTRLKLQSIKINPMVSKTVNKNNDNLYINKVSTEYKKSK